MDVDKLCPTSLEIVNTALGSQAVSVGIPALSIFSSVMEEDPCLFFTFPWWSSYARPRHLILLPQFDLLPRKCGGQEASAFNQIILIFNILLIYWVSDLARKMQNQLDFTIWILKMIGCLFSPNTEDFKCCQAIVSNTCILITYCVLKATK